MIEVPSDVTPDWMGTPCGWAGPFSQDGKGNLQGQHGRLFVRVLGEEGPTKWRDSSDWEASLGPALPWAGQDWDCSLHQLSRGVSAMAHLGYSFTDDDRMVIVGRLVQWSTNGCENRMPGCQADTASCGYAGAPIERDDRGVMQPCWPIGSGTGTNCPAGTPGLELLQVTASDAVGTVSGGVGSPFAPQAVDLLAAAVALVRCGALAGGGDGANSRAVAILRALATLYRFDGANAGWADYDDRNFVGIGPQPPPPPPGQPIPPPAGTVPSMGGTFAAIATLIVLAGSSPWFGAEILGPLPPPLPGRTRPLGLRDFKHILGLFDSRIAYVQEAPAPW
jgi:hypothetical protein